MMEEAQQLLQDSALAEAVRPGDVYALMIECVAIAGQARVEGGGLGFSGLKGGGSLFHCYSPHPSCPVAPFRTSLDSDLPPSSSPSRALGTWRAGKTTARHTS